VREGEKGGKKKILFHGNVCAYLTCRLMGDPSRQLQQAVTIRIPHKALS